MPDTDDASPAELIDARIAELDDWRGETLARVRALIHQAEPDVVATVEWRTTRTASDHDRETGDAGGGRDDAGVLRELPLFGSPGIGVGRPGR